MARKRRANLQTAEKHAARGKFEAAINEYEKVLASDPSDTNTLNRVGDLYVRLKRIDKAIQRFERAAEHFYKEGFYVKAIAIYKKIIRLDPTRIDIYESLADLYHRQGLINEALTQYQVVADYYSSSENTEKVLKIHERMVELQPSNPSHRVRLAELYCEADRLPDATQQYREIAAFMLAHAKVDEAIKVYQGAFDLDPKDLNYLADALFHFKEEGYPEAASMLLDYARKQNPKADGVASLAGFEGEPAEAGESAEPVAEPVEPSASEGLLEEEAPVDEEESTDVAQLSTIPAAEVPIDPPTETEVELDLSELESLDPGDLEVEDVAPRSDEAAGIDQKHDVAGGVEEQPVAPQVPVDPALVRAAELVNEARILSNYELEDKAIELCQEALGLDPRSLEAHSLVTRLYATSDLNELAVEWGRKTAAMAMTAELPEVWDELQGFLRERGFEIEGSRIEAPEVVEPVKEEPPSVEDAKVEEQEVNVTPAVEDGGTVTPGEKLDWLGETPTTASDAEQTSDELFAQEDEFFDLAAELEQELAEDETPTAEDGVIQPDQPAEQSLEEIVEGFKRGVAETLSAEDYDTHYNLGIAYREMGLLDEAIGEFQLAAKDPRYLVECCSMLGTCFLEKGFADLAVKWYQRGLDSPRISENETLGLLYELGNLQMSTGKLEAALETFSEVYGTNSNYRDVVARLAELKQADK